MFSVSIRKILLYEINFLFQAADQHYANCRSNYLSGQILASELPPSLLPYIGHCGWRFVPSGPRIVPGSVKTASLSDGDNDTSSDESSDSSQTGSDHLSSLSPASDSLTASDTASTPYDSENMDTKAELNTKLSS